MTPIQPIDINKYITTIRINFENAYKTQTDEEREILIKSWFAILKDYPKEICDVAVLQSIKYAKFAPRIGDIVEQIEKMQSAYDKTAEELWSELVGALAKVRRANYHGNIVWWDNGRRINPAEETLRIYNELSPELKEYVGDLPEMVSLSRQETLEYEKGRFNRAMPTIKERAKTRRETPENIERLIQGLAGNLALECDGMKLLRG